MCRPGWGVALDVTRAVDLFGDYLETLGGVVAPHVLVAIDAFELKQVGARCRRVAADVRAVRCRWRCDCELRP